MEPNIYRQKIKLASYKQYLISLLTSRKTQTEQHIPHIFLLCLKRNQPQIFKKWQQQRSFSLVCLLLEQLVSMNVLYSL